MTHPDVFLDLPLTFDSLHKTVDQIVTVPFLRNFIGELFFCVLESSSQMSNPSHASRLLSSRHHVHFLRIPREGGHDGPHALYS
jgi:hypothetical protein